MSSGSDEDYEEGSGTGDYSEDYSGEGSLTESQMVERLRQDMGHTATMVSEVSVTASDLSEDDDDDEEELVRSSRKALPLVSSVAALLLPRSAKTTMRCGTVLAICVALATVLPSLALLHDEREAVVRRVGFTTALFESAAAQASLAYFELTLTGAVATAADATWVAEHTAAAQSYREAVSFAVRTARSDAGVWPQMRAAYAAANNGTAMPAPSTDAAACAHLTTTVTTGIAPAGPTEATVSAYRAAFALPTGMAQPTLALLAALVDLQNAAEAAPLAASPTTTIGGVAVAPANVRRDVDELVTAAAACVAALQAPASPPSAAVAGVTSAEAAAAARRSLAVGLRAVPLDVVVTAVAVSAWADAAAATAARMRTGFGGLAATTPATAPAPFAAVLNAFRAADAQLTAFVASMPSDAFKTAAGMLSPTLTQHIANALAARPGSFPVNGSVIHTLAAAGLADMTPTTTPWLATRAAADPQLRPPTAAFPCADVVADTVAVRATLDAQRGAITMAAEAEFRRLSDMTSTNEHYDALVAAGTVCSIGVALLTLYVQWGVASRVSASAMPFRSFVAGLWTTALVLIAVCIWAPSLSVAAVSDAALREAPRAAFGNASFLALVDAQAVAAGFAYAGGRAATAAAPSAPPNPVPGLRATGSLETSVIAPVLASVAAGDLEYDTVADEAFGYDLRQTAWFQPSLTTAQATRGTATTAACALVAAATASSLTLAASLETPAAATGITAAVAQSAADAAAASTASDTLQAEVVRSTGRVSARCSVALHAAGADARDTAWFDNELRHTALQRSLAYGARRATALAAVGTAPAASGAQNAALASVRPLRSRFYAGAANVAASRAELLVAQADAMAAHAAAARASARDATAATVRRIAWGTMCACVVHQLMVRGLWNTLFGAAIGSS